MKTLLIVPLVLVIGLILYFAGNYIIGQNNSGGKRLIIFFTGLLAVATGAIFTFLPIKEGELNEWFTFFILGMGIMSTLFGITFLMASICAGKERIDKVFDKITDGIQF